MADPVCDVMRCVCVCVCLTTCILRSQVVRARCDAWLALQAQLLDRQREASAGGGRAARLSVDGRLQLMRSLSVFDCTIGQSTCHSLPHTRARISVPFIAIAADTHSLAAAVRTANMRRDSAGRVASKRSAHRVSHTHTLWHTQTSIEFTTVVACRRRQARATQAAR